MELKSVWNESFEGLAPGVVDAERADTSDIAAIGSNPDPQGFPNLEHIWMSWKP